MADVKNYPFIEGKNLSLCAANIENINLYASWDNHPDVRKYARNLFPKVAEEYKKYMLLFYRCHLLFYSAMRC